MTAGPVAGGLVSSEASRELTDQWQALRRAATAVALLSSPAFHRRAAFPLPQRRNANDFGQVVVQPA